MALNDFAASQPLMSAPPIRPAPISRTAVMAASGLSGTFQDGGGHCFLCGLSAPQYKLERRVIVLAGFDGEMQKRLALRTADAGIGEDEHMPEQHGAVLGP